MPAKQKTRSWVNYETFMPDAKPARPPEVPVRPRHEVPRREHRQVPRVPRRPGIPGQTPGWPVPQAPKRFPGQPIPMRLPGPWRWIDWVIDIPEWTRNPNPWRPHPDLGPATLKCVANPATNPGAGYSVDPTHTGWRNGFVNESDCGLELQSWAGARPGDADASPSSAGNFTMVMLQAKTNGPGGDPTGRDMNFADRARYYQVWWISSPGGFDIPATIVEAPPIPMLPEPDPNHTRNLPGPWPVPDAGQPTPVPYEIPLPDPWPAPVNRDLTHHDIQMGVGTILESWMDEYTDLPPKAWTGDATRPGTSVWPGNSPGTGTRPGTGAATGPLPKLEIPPAGRQPTRIREKERKVQPRSARFASLLFNSLDNISEWSEVVDAIYEALPKDVRTRWGRGRPDQPFIDNAGQYGIDGADWKAQAIYHNLDKVDWDIASKNVIKNSVEDRILGDIHRASPRNEGNAFAEAHKEISKQVDAWMGYLLDALDDL